MFADVLLRVCLEDEHEAFSGITAMYSPSNLPPVDLEKKMENISEIHP